MLERGRMGGRGAEEKNLAQKFSVFVGWSMRGPPSAPAIREETYERGNCWGGEGTARGREGGEDGRVSEV